MSEKPTQNQSLGSVIEQLRALEGVEGDIDNDGQIELTVSYDGATAQIVLDPSADDYRSQKIQYNTLRETLTQLGISEGQTFVAAKLPRRPMTPLMRAAREKQKKTFEAWQELWGTLRKAEKALDVEYEIRQMRDYY